MNGCGERPKNPLSKHNGNAIKTKDLYGFEESVQKLYTKIKAPGGLAAGRE